MEQGAGSREQEFYGALAIPSGMKPASSGQRNREQAFLLLAPRSSRLATRCQLLVHAMRGCIECVSAAVDGIGRDTVWEIGRVGADIRKDIRGPGGFLDVPAFDR